MNMLKLIAVAALVACAAALPLTHEEAHKMVMAGDDGNHDFVKIINTNEDLDWSMLESLQVSNHEEFGNTISGMKKDWNNLWGKVKEVAGKCKEATVKAATAVKEGVQAAADKAAEAFDAAKEAAVATADKI